MIIIVIVHFFWYAITGKGVYLISDHADVASTTTDMKIFTNILSHSFVYFIVNLATSVLVDVTSVKMDSDNDNR